MNDRYLYRAKRTDNLEWVEGHYITNEKDPNHAYIGYLFGVVDGMVHDTDIVEVIPSTICQCTALKDKNGKLIWENDIVKDNVIFGSVSWDDINARFVIDDIYDGYQDYSDWWSEVEVIGSAIDNPELVEVGE